MRHSGILVANVLELPCVFLSVVDESWCIIALVQILQHGGQHFGAFIGQVDTARSRLVELGFES